MKRSLKEILTEALRLFFKDIKAVKWAIILVIAYFAFLNRLLYTLCPLTLITGYPCPGCGMTRAAFCVLRMDFSGAWEIHPFIYPIIALFIIFCFQRYILQKKNMQSVKKGVVVLAVAMIMFYLWRMWRCFPDTPPMTYYRYNFINRILNMIK